MFTITSKNKDKEKKNKLDIFSLLEMFGSIREERAQERPSTPSPSSMASSTHHHNGLKQDQHHPIIVLVLPFPAQGHLGPTLQFSRQILSYNIPVHYVSSPIHNRQAKLRAHSPDPHDMSRIQFHDFSVPFASPPPNPNAIGFPAHLQPAFEASLHLRRPVAALVRSLSQTAKRIVIVHDQLLASVVQDCASMPNAETYAFYTSPAFFGCFFYDTAAGKPFQMDAGSPNVRLTLDGCFTPEFMDFVANVEPFRKTNAGVIYNSCGLIEGAYLDRLKKEGGINQWTIGPLIPPSIIPNRDDHSTKQAKCLEWLNKQARNSVIYISFGTTTTLPDEQIKELATGLEESKIKFIWVMRDADRGDVLAEDSRSFHLLEGFEERTGGIGMVTREWMPQLEILGNEAIGGFMTHCGWNSCLETISNGVPVAAWPMHSDQPCNAVLLTMSLKIGLIVREWDRREEIVTSTRVREAVRTLMASEEGDEMRKRAEELGVGVRKSVMEGGASHMELESFIAHITR